VSAAFTIRARVFQTPTPTTLSTGEQFISIDDAGQITAATPAGPDDLADITLPPKIVLLPGLIDTHIHAPQWPQLATALDRPLEEWLFDHTFPLETRFADLSFATRVWESMVPALLANGTTTAVYHASRHEPATTALAAACLRHGQRAFVGRVAMDHPTGTPEWYRDVSATASIAASERSIAEIRALDGRANLVEPIVTPRFIPACTDAALQGLGELAGSTKTRIQTHCSESDWEHDYVLDRHGMTDTESLDRFGLVRDHTVLAHATHLTPDDRSRLISHGAGVSHCPLSNAYFSDAVFPARRSIEAGLRVGLGTDIAGGAGGAVLGECAHAVTSSRVLESGVDIARPHADRGIADSRIDITTAFWMATLGGADLLGIPSGLLVPGRVFDAIAVDLTDLGIWPELDDDPRTFEKVVRRANASAIRRVWVDGVDVTPDRTPASDTCSD
jgi:guanine deaminase